MIRMFDFLLRPRPRRTRDDEGCTCNGGGRDPELNEAQARAKEIEERLRMLKIEKEVLLGPHSGD